MIAVTKLDGTQYHINPHQIEYIEHNPDVTLCMMSGKRLVVRESYSSVLAAIIEYRRTIGCWHRQEN